MEWMNTRVDMKELCRAVDCSSLMYNVVELFGIFAVDII
jgi:hypothetical protein